MTHAVSLDYEDESTQRKRGRPTFLNRKMSRSEYIARYRAKKAASGLKARTLWINEQTLARLKALANDKRCPLDLVLNDLKFEA